MSLSSDYQKLEVQGLVTLYELDATKLGAGILRWHGHIGWEDWLKIYQYAGDPTKFVGDPTKYVGKAFEVDETEKAIYNDIIWQGKTFKPITIKHDGLEMRGDGRASTPTLAVGNNIDGIQGAVSMLCMQYDDFAGAKLTIIRTLAKYLDAENFSSGNPQAQNEYTKQIWYIEQKTSDNNGVVSFELSNPVDFEGKKIPARQITGYCHWAICGRYRGEECKYRGTQMFTVDGEPTDDPNMDACGGRVHDCQARHGKNAALPFGGFPASRLMR